MNKNRLTLLLVIALIGAFIVVWDLPPGTFTGPTEDAATIRFPNTYLTNMHTREFNKDGFLSFELESELAEVFGSTGNKNRQKKANGVTRFKKPTMQFHSPDKPTWHVKGNVGIAHNNGEKFELRWGVNIWHVDAKGEKTEIKTVKLTIFPEREYAETDKPVTITTAEGTTEATGMRLFLNEQRFQLLSNVKGYYEPI